MKTFLKNFAVVIVGGAILLGVWFYGQDRQGVAPDITGPKPHVAEVLSKPGENKTEIPLKLPDNLSIEIFAKDLPGARVMVFDPSGNMWVSQTSAGQISQLIIQNGVVIDQQIAFQNLNNPHGLAFAPNSNKLYFAEKNKISVFELGTGTVPGKVADLPSGGGHFSRTIGFGPDGRLYVAVGSSCNVCIESDPRRAAVSSMNADGSDFKSFATGLRNTVFFTWLKDKMWGTDMGRDQLGDNVPPEEINVIEEGKNYGWPICYSNNIHDTSFDKNQYIQDPCNDKIPPRVEMQAHSAPLGLAFIPKGFGPKDWEGDLIVAFHGSWNSTVPTGYKLVRIKLDDQGKFVSTEDFISGWFQGSAALGRPVDVLFHGGALYVSDDKAGVIYKIR